MDSARIKELEVLLEGDLSPADRVATLLLLNQHLKGSDFQRGTRICSEAVSIAEPLGDVALLAKCHGDLARALWKVGDMVNAQLQFDKSRALLVSLGDHKGLALVYCGLGIVHGMLNDHANALEFFEKGVDASIRADDNIQLAHNLGNIGQVYLGLEDYPSALRYFAKALAIDRELGEEGQSGVSNMLTAIAGVMVHQGEYGAAIAKMEESLNILEAIGDMRGMATTLSNVGITYDKMGHHPHAVIYLNRALALAEKIHYGALIPEIHQNLVDFYEAVGDNEEALKHVELRSHFQVEEKRKQIQRNAARIIDPIK